MLFFCTFDWYFMIYNRLFISVIIFFFFTFSIASIVSSSLYISSIWLTLFSISLIFSGFLPIKLFWLFSKLSNLFLSTRFFCFFGLFYIYFIFDNSFGESINFIKSEELFLISSFKMKGKLPSKVLWIIIYKNPLIFHEHLIYRINN